MASIAIEMTIKKLTGMTTDELAEFAKAGDLQTRAHDEVTEALRLIESIEEDLRQQIASARRDLDRALEHLGAGYHLNEHGILQNTGTRIDMLAARRQDAYTRLNAAARMVAAIAATA